MPPRCLVIFFGRAVSSEAASALFNQRLRHRLTLCECKLCAAGFVLFHSPRPESQVRPTVRFKVARNTKTHISALPRARFRSNREIVRSYKIVLAAGEKPATLCARSNSSALSLYLRFAISPASIGRCLFHWYPFRRKTFNLVTMYTGNFHFNDTKTVISIYHFTRAKRVKCSI